MIFLVSVFGAYFISIQCHIHLHRLPRLGIRFLRSPAIAHPDHFDMRALLAYAIANNREDELIESGCSEIRKVGVLLEPFHINTNINTNEITWS